MKFSDVREKCVSDDDSAKVAAVCNAHRVARRVNREKGSCDSEISSTYGESVDDTWLR